MYLRVKEIAKILGISLRRAYKITRLKDFPSFRIGKIIFVEQDEFKNWIKEQKNETT